MKTPELLKLPGKPKGLVHSLSLESRTVICGIRDGQNRSVDIRRHLSKIPGSGIFLVSACLPQLSQAQNEVQPGEFIIEPPTLQNLGFEWCIDGD